MKMKLTKVEVVETTMVTPSEETPRRGLWLSNLDLVVPKMYMPLVYYYPAPQPGAAAGKGFFAPERLKAALAGALVPFYPLAGRLSKGGDGRMQIDCNGEGVLFVVAMADVTGDDIFNADYEPSAEIRQMFVPSAPASGEQPCPLAMFQVTFLSCGAVVLGTGIHHVTVDAVAAFHFMQTWTRLARGVDATEACTPALPSHDRTPLAARSPPRPAFDHTVYSASFASGEPRPFVPRVYTVSPGLLADLRSRCAPGASTYSVVTAHLWRCACVARGLAATSDTRLGVAVNVRSRLHPPLPRGFFGNAVVRDVVTARVGDFLDGSVGFVADTIKTAVDRFTDAFVRSLVDHLEVEPEQGDKAKRRQLMRESDLWAVSWLGMPVYDADFGWGAPRLVAPVQMFGIGTAYVMPRASRDDGIAVLFELEPEYLQRFEKVFYGDY